MGGHRPASRPNKRNSGGGGGGTKGARSEEQADLVLATVLPHQARSAPPGRAAES